MLERINSSHFDWLTWRNGTILDLFGIKQREQSIINNRYTLRKHAIGWTFAEDIPCRPKKNCMAVMFVVKDIQFWTHLTKKEFNTVFDKGNIK